MKRHTRADCCGARRPIAHGPSALHRPRVGGSTTERYAECGGTTGLHRPCAGGTTT